MVLQPSPEESAQPTTEPAQVLHNHPPPQRCRTFDWPIV